MAIPKHGCLSAVCPLTPSACSGAKRDSFYSSDEEEEGGNDRSKWSQMSIRTTAEASTVATQEEIEQQVRRGVHFENVTALPGTGTAYVSAQLCLDAPLLVLARACVGSRLCWLAPCLTGSCLFALACLQCKNLTRAVGCRCITCRVSSSYKTARHPADGAELPPCKEPL